LAKGTLNFLAGKNWRRRLHNKPAGVGRLVRLLGSLPDAPRSDADLLRMLDGLCGRQGRWEPTQLSASAAWENTGPAVAFFAGCANAGLLADTSRRTRELLAAVGCRLENFPHQDCCGALAAHTGRPGRAADLRRRNMEALAGVTDTDTVVVVEAAGCGHELINYGDDFAARVRDAAVLLAGLDLPPLGEASLKVVYHDPCHARHGQGIHSEPRQLLASIPGLVLVEPAEAEVCCGSGGAWGLRYPEISEDLGLRKASNLAATGADLVVTSNPGCLGQIADALHHVKPGLPILPLTDLLWYAVARGQKKAG
jgi:glycolate oxidase iron-sulfur subunit